MSEILNPVLQAVHLRKTFSSFLAVDDFSISLAPGEIVGILGSNGAGKTTILRMLVGLIRPDSGEITVAGFDLRNQFRDAISRIGSLIEIPAFYGYLSARQNLQLLLRLSEQKTANEQIDNVLRQVKLLDRADDAVKKYSQGMRQRLGIAAAILRKPPIVILDEPANGLDPEGMIEIREFIRSLAKETGTAVLLSSHLLSEMEMLCDRVFILNKGKTIAAGSVKELILPEDENLEQLFLRLTRTKAN